jgi:hypothetical protein
MNGWFDSLINIKINWSNNAMPKRKKCQINRDKSQINRDKSQIRANGDKAESISLATRTEWEAKFYPLLNENTPSSPSKSHLFISTSFHFFVEKKRQKKHNDGRGCV